MIRNAGVGEVHNVDYNPAKLSHLDYEPTPLYYDYLPRSNVGAFVVAVEMDGEPMMKIMNYFEEWLNQSQVPFGADIHRRHAARPQNTVRER